MAIIYVKKDGSGNATTIQQGIQLAALGDTVEVEAGTFNENIDLWKGITLKGAGISQTIITGAIRTAPTARAFVFVTGQTTLNLTQAMIDSGVTTADYQVGRVLTASGIPANTRLVSKTATSITLSAAVTSAAASRTIAMGLQNDATIRVRGTNGVIRDMKFLGFDWSSPASEVAAIYLRNTGLGSAAASGWEIFNCEFVADGEYALLTDFAAGVGNLNIHNCKFTGKTFVGTNPGFGNQYSVANVPRQLVVIQSVNTAPIIFRDNEVEGITGGLTVDGIQSYNTAVTIDPVASQIIDNNIDVESGYGYGLRARGLNSIITGNTNVGTTAGYYILPSHSVGVLITTGTMISNSSKYWVCIQDHTSSATNAPTGVDGASYWSEITLEQVNSSSSFGVGVQILQTNSNVFEGLITPLQENPGQPIAVSYNAEFLKSFSVVSSNPQFSNEADWNLVGYIYKNTTSSKRLYVGFKNNEAAKAMKLRQAISGETYELNKVIIAKADKTFLAIKRADVNKAERYDITLI